MTTGYHIFERIVWSFGICKIFVRSIPRCGYDRMVGGLNIAFALL